MNDSASSRPKMVGWFDPGQLIRTGIDVAVSTIFGRNSDFRLLEALASREIKDYYDHSVECEVSGAEDDPQIVETGRPLREIWVDYIADVGDGWNSTYTAAYNIAQDLQFDSPDAKTYRTSRGSVLIFGGDEVYPVASRKNYQQKLVQAYEAALKADRSLMPPFAYAVPGNHDWYDSLVSFTRLFCSGRRFAGWQTRQQRSYFALKLPHGWWLLGTDVQLDSDIDEAQVAYFRKVAKSMGEGDRIILCNAEPHWVYAALYHDMDSDYTENNLAYLEENVLGKKVSVFLAGDLHHYRRHADETGAVQKITCGGGGAFLHPTHKPVLEVITEQVSEGIRAKEDVRTFRKKAAYPDEKTSTMLAFRNLNFVGNNPWAGVLTGVLYPLCWWSFMPPLRYTMTPAAFAILIVVGFYLFTDTHSKWYQIFGGGLHGIAHLAAAVGIGSAIASLMGLSSDQSCWGSYWKVALASILPAWVIGSEIIGLYLLISLNVFGRHNNEAFSSLAIPDYKSFLRMHINTAGELTIYAVGIEHVARDWEAGGATGGQPTLKPNDANYTPPKLIEPPIAVR